MTDEDRALGEALRRHADELTAELTDTEPAYDAVFRRARGRRNRRTAAIGGLAAAAAVAGVLVVASATNEQATVRAPATEPTVAPTVPTTAPGTFPGTTVPATSTTAPTTAATTTAASTATPTTATTVPARDVETRTFTGAGGSITVQRDGDAVALAGDPEPATGYTARIDDDGPDRVRVRFERDSERTEIRIEVEDGRLVPQIDEG